MARFDAFSPDHDSLFNYSKFSPSNGSLASLTTMPDSSCVQKFKERSGRLLDVENEKNQLIQVSNWSIIITLKLMIIRTCSIVLTPPKNSLNRSAWTMTEKPTITVRDKCEKICCKNNCEKLKL